MLVPTVALALAVLNAKPFGPAEYRTSKIEITPPEALPLGGYTARNGRRADVGGDPLYARSIVVSHGPLKFAVVSVELLTVPESLAAEVAKKAGFPVFLAATHTHCAPDSQMLNDRMTFAIPGIARFDERWLKWYSDRIAAGIRAAYESRGRPLNKVTRRIWHVALNRGRRRLAEPDRAATLIEIGGRPVVFHYSAHAVFHGPEWNRTSGDWPGETDRMAFLTLVGAIGDVSPDAQGSTPKERISSFWTLQADAARSARGQAFWPEPIAYASVPIVLPPQLSWKLFAKENRIPEPIAQTVVERFAPKQARITAFRIGKICVIGVPGEPTSALGRRIRDEGRRIGFDTVLVCSHVNGWAGYLLEPDDYARGGYEASLDFYGPEMAARVHEAARGAMLSLSGKPMADTPAFR